MRFCNLLVGATTLLALAALCACAPPPRPFEPEAKRVRAVAPAPGPSSALVVYPFANAAGEAAAPGLTEAVIAALRARQVAAVPPGPGNRYRLSGQADLVVGKDGGALLRLNIRLLAPDGGVTAAESWRTDIDGRAYRAAAPALIRRLGESIAERMLALMAPLALPGPGEVDRLSLQIAGIRHAPGDGDQALTEAIIDELKRQGVGATLLHGHAEGLWLQPVVTVGILDASNDLARIVWILRDSAGDERGRVTQQNTVPTGRLNGRWGVLARLVAAAAAPDIADLMRRTAPGG